MDYLCHHHCNEYIYSITYEIDMHRYSYFKEDLKVFGNNADELIHQVIGMCVWEYKHYQMDPYILYMLWFLSPLIENWRMPTVCARHCDVFREEMKKKWQYLIFLLQFWMDSNDTIHLQGGPIRPMSSLVKITKEMANLVLSEGFQVHWKHIIENTLWYLYGDYCCFQ